MTAPTDPIHFGQTSTTFPLNAIQGWTVNYDQAGGAVNSGSRAFRTVMAFCYRQDTASERHMLTAGLVRPSDGLRYDLFSLNERPGGNFLFRARQDGNFSFIEVEGTGFGAGEWYCFVMRTEFAGNPFNVYVAPMGVASDGTTIGTFPTFPGDFTLFQTPPTAGNTTGLVGFRYDRNQGPNTANAWAQIGVLADYDTLSPFANGSGGISHFHVHRRDNGRLTDAQVNTLVTAFPVSADDPVNPNIDMWHAFYYNVVASVPADFPDKGTGFNEPGVHTSIAGNVIGGGVGLPGHPFLTTPGGQVWELNATASGVATVSADDLTIPRVLSAQANGLASVSNPTLDLLLPLVASSSGSATVSGALTITLPLEATAQGVATASGAISTDMGLSGTAQGQATATASLTIQLPLEATASGVASVSGNLVPDLPLAGTSSAVATVSGDLETEIFFPPTLIETGATVTGNLVIDAKMSATAQGVASVSGNLTREGGLEATAQGSSSASASLTITLPLAGTIQGTGSATGDLTRSLKISGSALGVASVSGTGIDILLPLAATASGVASPSGDLSRSFGMTARSSGVATVTAALSVSPAFSGQVNGVATVSGNLVVIGEIPDGEVRTSPIVAAIRDVSYDDRPVGPKDTRSIYGRYIFDGTESSDDIIELAVVEPWAMIHALAVHHDQVATGGAGTLSIGTELDPDAFLSGEDLQDAGVGVMTNGGVQAVVTGEQYVIRATFGGDFAFVPGSEIVLQAQALFVNPRVELR